MERAFAKLILALYDQIDITVISSVLSPELRSHVSWHRIPVPQRPFPARFLGFFIQGWLAVHRVQVDVICTLGAIVPNKTDIVSVHYCHEGRLAAIGSLAYPDSSLVYGIYTRFTSLLALLAERWCYRPSRVRTFVAVSHGLAEELKTYYPGVPVTVISNGVDARRFQPNGVTRQSLRADNRTTDDTVVCLFVGGDWDRKGLALAISGVADAAEIGLPVHLWVVGSGNIDRFHLLARAAGIEQKVSFFSPRSDIERYYQAADIFVLPSSYETFSLVCFEAAACGLPLIITDISGASDLVGQNEAGFIVEKDGQSVGAAIALLASDGELRKRMGNTARERTEPYTWEKTGEDFLELCRSLIIEP